MEDVLNSTENFNLIKENKRKKRKITIWMIAIFVFITAIEIAAAYIFVYKGDHIMGDALSRTANAYYIFNLIPHKLASIGFVWNPLPSLLQIPIVYFAKYWQPLASVGFAGCILTSIFAGINAALLFRYFRQVKLNIAICLFIILLYSLNPFVFFYGFNGMSETVFCTALIMCTANFAMWLDDRKTFRLVVVGLMLVVAFLTRYETFALALGLGFSMLIAVYWMKDRKSPFTNKPVKMKWDYAVATGTVIFVPVLYTILIWMFLNWSIMGDPLYFLHSAYSNEAQSMVGLSHEFREQMQYLIPALKYTLVRMFPFMLPFFVITAERIYSKRLVKPDYLILLVLVGSISVFHLMMLMMHKSFGWLRFYCFSLFICVAWFPFEITQLKGRLKKTTIGSLCLSLILSSTILGYYFTDIEIMKEEVALFVENTHSNAQRDLANIINEKYSDSILLFDSFTLSRFIVNLENPQNVITNVADDVFDNAVDNLPKSDVDYIIVPTVFVVEKNGEEGGVGTLDVINQMYPNLFEHGAEWAELVYDNDYLHMYRIIRPDTASREVADFLNNREENDAVILYDAATSGELSWALDDTKNAITTISDNFDDAIEDPKEYSVQYVVISTPEVDKTNGIDKIAAHYSEFMTEGVDFGELIFENENYQVFEVAYDNTAKTR